MIVTHLNIQNFLRFHDLTIDMDGQRPRLVLLVGTNGSGKSSVLSLFNLLKWRNKDRVKPGSAPKLETDFGRDRINPPDYQVGFETLAGETFVQGADTTLEQKERYNLASSLYGRSSMINVSRLASYEAPTDEELKSDYDMSKTMIDVDNRFTHDLAHTLQEIVQESFTNQDGPREFLKDLLTRINQSLKRIFDKPLCIQIERLGGGIGLDPIEIRIKKGDFVFGYERLSQGEKNVLNIVFNLWRRAQLFPDAVYAHPTLRCNTLPVAYRVL